MFNFTNEEFGGKVSVKFYGDLDIDATEIVEQDLVSSLSQSNTRVEIDFNDVEFVDSSGIGLLITLISTLKMENKSPTVINVSDDVQVVFDLLQLSEIVGKDTFV